MDYNAIYNRLIARAKERCGVKGYSELHHIVPRCMKGANSTDNLVELTPEEHVIAHLLLTRIYPHNSKLIYAANMMANRNNKYYGWLRRKHADNLRSRKMSAESKAKMSIARKGVVKPPNWRAAISEAKKLNIVYDGVVYKGWDDLKRRTGISKHLYKKYNGTSVDPASLIGKHNIFQHTHEEALQQQIKTRFNKRLASAGKAWYNNGHTERLLRPNITALDSQWTRGRL